MGDLAVDVYSHFNYCPLCYVGGSVVAIETEWSGFGGKDYLCCSVCGAKWHIKRGKWAKLVKTSFEGKGSEFLLKKYKLEFWEKMAYEGLKAIKEKEKTEEDPLKVLQLRYAKGEISKENPKR